MKRASRESGIKGGAGAAPPDSMGFLLAFFDRLRDFPPIDQLRQNRRLRQAQTEYEPEFLEELENHTVTQGRDVSFTCVVNHLGSYKVAWIKSDSKAILAIHTHLVAHNNRLSVTHNGHNTWKLKVSNVQKNDSGTYMCQINTDPMRSQMGYLEVTIPPDILNEDGGDDHVATEGGNVRVKCRATGMPEPRVSWKREDLKNIVLRQEGGVKEVKSFDGENLELMNIQRTDMGVYLCIASNGIPPSVSKRILVQVHFHPSVKVPNDLFGAPVGTDVSMQCNVETSPKALNSWFKETGEKLMDSNKYIMEEIPINDYTWQLNLTIRNLEKRDFGSYVCQSSNALGKSEGVVRLQERHIIKTTIAPIVQIPDRGRKKPKEKLSPPPPPPTPPPRKKKKPPKSDAEHVPTPMNFYPQTPPSPTARTPPWILHQNEIPTDGGQRVGGPLQSCAFAALAFAILAQ
ncbi:Immunoglobulin domain [Nesidiocoris tenuis]|uniref:Immunoglobulin domain n=1 Tax=Nesidiocoris tenuis TaxID=355587 RepID=A0ABN7ACF8_9HEMI|nr:Immunoglobulin domain [Nesidiocoris tenuis]